jgi:HK97 family phage portal protein
MSEHKTVPILKRVSMAFSAFRDIVSGERRGNLAEPPPWLLSMLGVPTAAAGVDVIPETAITLSVVWACVKILSESVGMLPLEIYKTDGVKRERAIDHRLWSILRRQPNPEITALTWKQTVMTHLGLWGNSYSQIIRDGLGRPLQLWPIHPQRVRVMRDSMSKRLYYTVAPMFGETGYVVLDMEDMLHIKGLAMNGLVGMSPVGAGREAIGLGLAEQEYGARFFSNGAQTSGVLEHPGQLSDKAYDRLKKSIEDQIRSLRDKHRMLILEEGLKWQQVSLPPEDAQFLGSREFNIRDIARFYRMPLYKLSENITSKSTSIEQMSIEFLSDTIMPWLTNIEEEITCKLLNKDEQEQFFPKFKVDAYLRGDTQTRYAAYHIARQDGWMSANEIRAEEHMNPIEGGDQYLVPLNMVPADKAGEEGAKKDAKN